MFFLLGWGGQFVLIAGKVAGLLARNSGLNRDLDICISVNLNTLSGTDLGKNDEIWTYLENFGIFWIIVEIICT